MTRGFRNWAIVLVFVGVVAGYGLWYFLAFMRAFSAVQG